jgi:hypothetical protein
MKTGTLLGTIVASAAAMGLGSCVGILRHDPLVPDRLGAERALEAARRSSFIQGRESLRVDTQERIATLPSGISGPLTPARPTEEAWGVRGCLKSGQVFALTDVDIRDDAICGSTGGATRCIAYSQMSAIALPRDATVIGYFPVMQDLVCHAVEDKSPSPDVR